VGLIVHGTVVCSGGVTWSNLVQAPSGNSFTTVGPTAGENTIMCTNAIDEDVDGTADDGCSGGPPVVGTAEGVVPAGVLRNVWCSPSGPPICPTGNSLWDDGDADGLPDLVEMHWLSHFADPDSDNDGLNDFEEMAAGTDPLVVDSDGDATGNARKDPVDNCPLVANTVQTDTDGDGFGDACDTYTPPGGANADGDGLANIKSTGAGTRGAAGITNYGFSGLGGCSAAEEAFYNLSDTNPRDFMDVNNSGHIDSTDKTLVQNALGSFSGDAGGKYKHALDVNPTNTTSGRGSGNIDATDKSLVVAQIGRTCAGAP
jgi:hypothetical protein